MNRRCALDFRIFAITGTDTWPGQVKAIHDITGILRAFLHRFEHLIKFVGGAGVDWIRNRCHYDS